MNYRMVSYIIGQIVRVEGILMIPSLVVSVIYGESAFAAFLIPIVLSVAAGTLLTIKKPSNPDIFAKEGFVTVGLSWIIMSLIGALPFVIDGCIPSFVDAFFETVSGFTTTGASILTEIESLGRGMLFWRSFTHFVGGMGVLVFVLAILPQADTRSVKLMHVMRAEVPGPKVGKLVSKIGRTARIMYGIYIGLTVIEMILLLAGGMPMYDSIVNSFATAGTGGFAIKNASIAAYDSAYIDYVIGIFMFLFGVNFNLYYLILIGHVGEALRSEELRWYFSIIAGAVLLIAWDIRGMYGGLTTSLRHAFFQVATIITTTGFSTVDFDLWPTFSKGILILLMFIGACASSTGGGLKVSRIIILLKTALKEVRYYLNPREIRSIRCDGRYVEHSVVTGVSVYLVVYMFVFAISVFLISIEPGHDWETCFTAVASCLNNIGPGMGGVGPMCNFDHFSDFAKCVLSADMLLGRLELFPMLALCTPAAWKN